TNYVKDKFGKYFAKVVPISAIKALEGRAKEKDILIEDENINLLSELKKELLSSDIENNNNIEKLLSEHKNRIKTIKLADTTLNTKLLEDSNIQEVL
ncbi:ATP-binding protein, partial [Aliarcobacter butzleri]